MTITVQGLKKRSIKGFLRKFNKQNPIGIDLSELGMDEPNNYITKLYYEDNDGRKAHAKVEDKFEIRPTIVLPTEVSNENKTPNLELIIKFTDDLLDKVKNEINY